MANKGFTLIETLVALAIGMITMAMVMTIFANGLQYMRTMRDSQALNSNATFFLNRVTYLVKQAKTIYVDPSDPGKLNLTFSNGPAQTLDNSLLQDNGVEATTTFTQMQRSVRINFVIQKGSQELSGTTTVAQREF